VNLRDLILDPVAIKEVSGSSRRWQTYVGRGLHLAMIGWIVVAFWIDLPQYRWRATVSDYADFGRELFYAFVALQMGVVALGAVAAAADLVTKESRAGTLGLLACSPLTPWRIASGKWKAAMAQTSTMILCGAPVLAICVFLGGATAWDLGYSFTLTVAIAALSAAVSLYFSSVFRTGIAAILVSLAVLAAVTFLPIAWLEAPSRESPATMATCFLHPVYAGAVASMPLARLGLDGVLHYGWISATVACLLVSLVLVRRTAARIAALTVRTPSPPLLSRTFDAMDRFYEAAGPERIRNIRLFDGGGVWETRAILWKELKTRASGKLRNAVRISMALLLALSCTFWFPTEWLDWVIWTLAGTLLFMALASGSSLFVKEKEERKWDILLATPLSAGEIVQAKVLAGLVPLAPVVIIYVLFWWTWGWFHHVPIQDRLIVLAVTLLPVLLAFSLSAVCSLRARSLRGAFMTAFGGMVALLVGLPVAIVMGSGMNERHLLLCVSPAPYIESMARSRGYWTYWYMRRLGDVGEELAWFISLYGGLTLLLLVYLWRRFNRIAGRSG
jgi:ABC-type transport system involved in multi-copper enzyme maturation permease subunit